MPTSSRRSASRPRLRVLAATAALLLAGAAPLLEAVPAGALDALARAPAGPPPGFRSAREALRTGMRDYNAGDKAGAVRALEYAATQGHALALWKLGRMYADGDGVPHDDLKAFEFFSRIADEGGDEAPDTAGAGVVASAFVSLGNYFLDGIKGSYVHADVERAHEMFQYAATYFGDPNAQYNLARLYLDGNGVDRDPRQAVRWFNLAAEKGHRPAQALLGQLLSSGEGIPGQRARGLMWLSLARESADAKREAWIVALQQQAWDAADEADREAARAQLDQFARRRR